jgi:NIMA (never in mitosis gene a)-related kinase
VISGKYDQIPAHYSTDLKNVIRSCLQVKSSERPDCDKLLAMPGLLNNITGTLDDIQALKEDTESLLQTIRCPRNLGMITGRLPAAQYK